MKRLTAEVSTLKLLDDTIICSKQSGCLNENIELSLTETIWLSEKSKVFIQIVDIYFSISSVRTTASRLCLILP